MNTKQIPNASMEGILDDCALNVLSGETNSGWYSLTNCSIFTITQR